MKAISLKQCLLGVFFLMSGLSWADSMPAVVELQKQWANVNYQLQGKAQLQAYEPLLAKVDEINRQFPDDAAVLIWSGIIKSSYAGTKGGIGALKYAKASKADLERALELDSNALAGSAYTSLGTLYFKVPGWPIGFGDDQQAKTLLRQALVVNPHGIDSNYFYAEFLRDSGDYVQAAHYYNKALSAPARPDRPAADLGRRREIETALIAIKGQLD